MMRLMQVFDLSPADTGKTLWWNPEDAIDPSGAGHLELPIEQVLHVSPDKEFPYGGVIVSADYRIIPGNQMVGLTEEAS